MTNCAVCSKPLSKRQRSLKQSSCSRSCSAKLQRRVKQQDWSDAELELLRSLIGERPLPVIVQRLAQFNKSLGRPCKTADAIAIKIRGIGFSVRPELDYWTTGELARILAVPRDRVERWCEKYGLPFVQYHRHSVRYIRAKDLVQFAKTNPHYFAGIEREALLAVLKQKRPVTGLPMPVQRLDTLQVFPSLKAAARQCFLHPSSIASAIARGGTSGGIKWRLLREDRS